MNIELIIFFVVWLASTEFVFFKFERGKGYGFFHEKIISMLTGMCATFVLFGFPWLLARVPIQMSEAPLGPIVYAWYYGIMLFIASFFLINYVIGKWIDGDYERKPGRKKK